MSQLKMKKMKLSQLDEMKMKMSQLKIGFDRKEWIKKYQKRKMPCPFCGKIGPVYKMKRHQRSLKCVNARLGKIKL